jgi:hypothetical protein
VLRGETYGFQIGCQFLAANRTLLSVNRDVKIQTTSHLLSSVDKPTPNSASSRLYILVSILNEDFHHQENVLKLSNSLRTHIFVPFCSHFSVTLSTSLEDCFINSSLVDIST